MLVDPSEMDRRFAAAEPQGEEEEPEPEARDVEALTAPLLARIPAPEAEIVRLYFIAHKKQRDIASIYGVSQAAISYRLHRALRRLRFIASLPVVDEVTMRAELGSVLVPVDVAIVVAMWRSTSKSITARELGLSISFVRDRFARIALTLTTSAEFRPQLARYRDLVKAIAGGRLLLWERRDRKFVYPEAA